MLIDSHCHLMDDDQDLDGIIKRAVQAGVNYLIVSGSERDDNEYNTKLVEKYDNIFASVGFHPCMAKTVSEKDFSDLESYIKNNKVVAIGEIGLDYHYGKDDIVEQQELFIRQLEIASAHNLPVVIHTRDAFLDTYEILKKYNLRGIIHCFSGSLDVAKKYIDLGYYLGIGGVVTFKNSKLKDVVEEVGLSNIVFETDSPYLSPIRGEKNEPANVKLICEFVSSILGESYENVSDKTTSNVISLFDLPIRK